MKKCFQQYGLIPHYYATLSRSNRKILYFKSLSILVSGCEAQNLLIVNRIKKMFFYLYGKKIYSDQNVTVKIEYI